MEDPRRRNHDLGQPVTQIEVAEPDWKDSVLVDRIATIQINEPMRKTPMVPEKDRNPRS